MGRCHGVEQPLEVLVHELRGCSMWAVMRPDASLDCPEREREIEQPRERERERAYTRESQWPCEPRCISAQIPMSEMRCNAVFPDATPQSDSAAKASRQEKRLSSGVVGRRVVGWKITAGFLCRAGAETTPNFRSFRGKLFLLTVVAFLLTVKRRCLQSLKALSKHTSHCKQKSSNCK